MLSKNQKSESSGVTDLSDEKYCAAAFSSGG